VFSGLAFHPPTPAVEQLYMSSFTIERCALRNSNTGSNNPTTTLTPVRSPEQLLMDSLNETYTKLLDKTSGKLIPFCVEIFSRTTRISKSLLPTSRTRKLGISSHQGIGHSEVNA
jgi:hypothetical protein